MLTKGFKLLAIRPLNGCSDKYRKNLKEGVIYKFYQNYHFLDKEGKEIDINNNNLSEPIFTIDSKAAVIDFYSTEKLNINISAVVGENGSGKSSLFELYYYFIYLFACTHKLDSNNNELLSYIDKDVLEKHDSLSKQIKEFNDLFAYPKNLKKRGKKILTNEQIKKIYKLSNEHDIYIPYLNIIDGSFNINFFKLQLLNKIDEYRLILEQQKKDFQKIEEQLSCAIVYEINGKIYDFSYSNKQFTFSKRNKKGVKKEDVVIDLEEYFYNVSLNYSHHALNSLTMGSWINKLFHKNDAYIAPVVINPMRNEGNFDINTELHLSKERIMMNIIPNLLDDKEYKILDKYKIKNVVYKLKHGILPISEFNFNDIKSQYKELLEFRSISNNNQYTLLDFATGYLRHKIKQLRKHYGLLFLKKGEEIPSFEEYMEELDSIAQKLILNDFSHITKKIGQVINFIQNFDQDIWNVEPITDLNKTIEVILDIEQLKQWVGKCDPQYSTKDSFELSIIAHPGIFYVDFVLEDSQGKELFFKDLSSGEQQLIFNTNTIIYHINNLNSTHKSIAKDEILRPRYKYLNIVLDEIELYYHPEFQRKFIQTLINELDKYSKNVDLPDRIESINICFLTHSPFILSDIPSQNVLKLKDGIRQPNDVTNNSFAANIHDLLNDEFFLKDGTMGEFAESKIKDFLLFYHRVAIGDNVSDLRKEFSKKKSSFNFLVQNIGEVVYRNILDNHLRFIKSKLFPDEKN